MIDIIYTLRTYKMFILQLITINLNSLMSIRE